MQYAEAVEAFFPVREGVALPAHVTAPTPARRLRDAIEPVAMNDVWSPAVHARTAALGLDFLHTYVASRGSALGDPHPGVVAASFAWFEPGLVSALYVAARTAVPRDVLVAARDAGVIEGLRAVLGLDVADVADRLAGAVEQLDVSGRPFAAGLLARGRPDDPHLRLWWAADVAREHRGDSHVAAALAAGFDAVQMNVLTELWLGLPLHSYSATRAWPAERDGPGPRRPAGPWAARRRRDVGGGPAGPRAGRGGDRAAGRAAGGAARRRPRAAVRPPGRVGRAAGRLPGTSRRTPTSAPRAERGRRRRARRRHHVDQGGRGGARRRRAGGGARRVPAARPGGRAGRARPGAAAAGGGRGAAGAGGSARRSGATGPWRCA